MKVFMFYNLRKVLWCCAARFCSKLRAYFLFPTVQVYRAVQQKRREGCEGAPFLQTYYEGMILKTDDFHDYMTLFSSNNETAFSKQKTAVPYFSKEWSHMLLKTIGKVS